MEDSQLHQAIVSVMNAIGCIEKKSILLADSDESFYSVLDEDVKALFKAEFVKFKLTFLPVNIDVKNTVLENGKMLTEVIGTYQITHISGESVQVQGYAARVENMDKLSTLAQTFAQKNALLLAFNIPLIKKGDGMATPIPQIASVVNLEDIPDMFKTEEEKGNGNTEGKDISEYEGDIFIMEYFKVEKPKIQAYLDKGYTKDKIIAAYGNYFSSMSPDVAEEIKSMTKSN